ncbi:MAG: sugar phosphate isomerase [Propionibacteriales bacterium]|nr:sugar phosphate isomerase [Propionibacteriales bacterium]
MTDLRRSRAVPSSWLDEQLDGRLAPEAAAWLAGRRDEVVRRPELLGEVFPAVARQVGRDVVDDAWTVDEAARALLLAALATVVPAEHLSTALAEVYRYGDAAEKRAALRALAVDEVAELLGDRAVPILADAIRTNDQRLLAAALGPYATAHLDADAFRQAVLKCVFSGVPLALVDGLPDRADADLAQMMTDFAAERTAAGREIPVDIHDYLAKQED